jgi:hypothetical protein
VSNVPAELDVIRRGPDPFHYEIVPSRSMTLLEYEDALSKIVLTPV